MNSPYDYFRFLVWVDTESKHLQIAAAVFDVGRFVQSPIPKILGYVTCSKVYLSTARYPVSSTIGDLERLSTSGADMGGVI